MAAVQRSLFDTVAAEGVHVNKINTFFKNFLIIILLYSLHYGHL
jgi:hypothetical protein